MSAGPCLLFFVVLLHIFGSSEGLEIITEPGKNVTLTCEVSDKDVAVVLEWSRDGLGDKKVFVIREGRPFPATQHESFRNRVFLLDPQMKNGNLSVVLKNVTVNDTGTYKCKVRQENDPPGTDLKLISSIHLQVSPPPPGEKGQQEGEKEDDGTQKTEGISTGVLAGIIVVVLFASIVVVIVVLWIYKKRNGSNQSSGGSNNHQKVELDHLNSDPNSERNTEQN